MAIFMFRKLGKGISRIFRGFFRVLAWPFARLRSHALHGWLDLAFFAGFVVLLVFFFQLRKKILTIEHEAPALEAMPAVPDTSLIPPPTLFIPSGDGMVHSSSLSIRGEVEENRIVSLTIDGRLNRVLLPQGTRFSFDDVQLHRGNNRIEVRAISPDGRASVLQTLVLRFENPTLSYLARDFHRGSLKEKTISLTFDGGSANNIAQEILDILRDEGVRCTFFLTGEFIRRFPETVKRIAAEGHEVGNHTWSHPHLTSFARNRRHETLPGITRDKVRSELEKASSLYRLVTGKDMAPLWRAPYGEYNQEILNWAAGSGFRHVGWTTGNGWDETMDTMDWVSDQSSKAYHSADEIANKILQIANSGKNGASGGVMLMHLGSERKDDFPHRKLHHIIQGLQKGGYRLVKVSEMMGENE